MVAVILGGAVWLWESVLEDRFVPKRWGVVHPGLVYRSGQLHPALVSKMLRKNQIGLVLSLVDLTEADEFAREADAAERRACQALGIERRVLPLRGDGTGEISKYAEAVATIQQAREGGRRVLVHCAAGTQRTGGVVAAFRVLVEGWDPHRAIDEMARYDWDPGDRRDHKVLEYLNEHMGELADRLVELDVIGQAPDPLPRFSLP